MIWNQVKFVVLAFGEDDYLFADMFISIIGKFNKVDDKESKIIYTFLMLKELMHEGLVEVFFVSETTTDKYEFKASEDIDYFIEKINTEWKELSYELPKPNQLFWITSTEKGLEYLKQNDGKGW